MLDQILLEVERQCSNFLSPFTSNELVLGDIAIAERDDAVSAFESVEDSLVLTLINIEEEDSLRNNYPTNQLGVTVIQQKPVLYLICIYCFRQISNGS